MRQSQLEGRLRLRHLLEVTEANEERMDAMRPRFQSLAREDAAPRVVSAFNLFQTPEPLATRLVELASRGRALGRVLEPSAGLGRLYRAIRASDGDARIVLVEIAPALAGELYLAIENDGAANLVQGDFLEMFAERLGAFDTVIMNPPFKQGRDIKHIEHARTLLAPGGRLVALCANGPRQRAKLMPLAASWEDLPPKSFSSEGTAVNAALLTIDG